MRSVTIALIWRFWREKAFGIVLLLALISVISVLPRTFYTYFQTDMEQVHYEQFIFIITILEMMGMIFIINIRPGRLDFPDHVYTKPMSSRMLVGTYLGLSMVSVIAIHLALVLLFKYLGHIDWPIGVPLLGLITFVLCAYAIFWSLSAVPMAMVITWLIVIAPLCIGWLEHRLVNKVTFAYVLHHDAPYMVLVALCATMIAYLSIKRARYGERLSSSRFWERLYTRFADLWPGKNWQLSTPQSAYFWFLWHTRGCLLPIVNLFMVVIALTMCVFLPETKLSIPAFMIGCGAANLFLLPFIGAMGIAHLGTKTSGISDNIATRPISNRYMLWAMLKTFVISYAVSWGIYLAGFAVLLILFAAIGNYESILAALRYNFPAVFPGVFLYIPCFWAAIGLTGSLFLTGRRWPVFILCALLFVVPIMMAFSTFLDRDTYRITIYGPLIWTFAVGGIGGTLWSFILMIKKRLMSPLCFGCLVFVYVASCVVCVSLKPNFVNTPTETALLFGLLALPFAPLATAPLALAWNRHR